MKHPSAMSKPRLAERRAYFIPEIVRRRIARVRTGKGRSSPSLANGRSYLGGQPRRGTMAIQKDHAPSGSFLFRPVFAIATAAVARILRRIWVTALRTPRIGRLWPSSGQLCRLIHHLMVVGCLEGPIAPSTSRRRTVPSAWL